ncbi:MAG: glycine betaine ABC transporter substrate-binding protein [Bradymonadia bacterium]
MRHLWWLWVLTLLGCSDDSRAIRVGAKSFAEQKVLAEALVILLRAEGLPAEQVVDCDDTYACQRALRSGQLDVMVDYTGTGLAFVGASPSGEKGLDLVRKLYKPLGLRWVVPMGFDNGYRLLVPSGRAQSMGWSSIADLARLEGGVRVAAPQEFLRRPGDGLAALLRRYGLRMAAEPLVVNDPQARMEALLDGRADVAVGYATDGAIVGLGLHVLEDSLGFFPPYEAAVVARTGAMSTHKDLEAVLNRLHNRISVEEMRTLNYAVEVSGQTAKAVARQLLEAEELIPEGSSEEGAKPIVVAVSAADGLTEPSQRALRAASQAFSGRPVSVKPVRDPVQAVVDGEARLAVLGAERFFPLRRRGRFIREDRIEAVAALGTRMVHVLRRADDLQVQDPLSGRVGVQERDSGGAWAGEALLSLSTQQAATSSDVKSLLGKLAAQELDAVVLLVPPGEAAVSEALSSGQAALVNLTGEWTANRVSQLPFFREARLPPATYPGQNMAMETLAAQVVIAGPGRQGLGEGGGGPAAAIRPSSRPLSPEQVKALSSATRISEAPDPALPSAWNVQAGAPNPAEAAGLSPSVVDTGLNVFVFAFLIWLIRVTLREDA